MTNLINKCWTVSKDVEHLVKCITEEAEQVIVNTKANGVAWDALKEKLKDKPQG